MATFPGTSGADNETSGFDVLYGLAGNDFLGATEGGFSYIEGGRDNDFLFFAEATFGEIYGGSGDDVMGGAALADDLDGGTGNDLVTGGATQPFVSGEPLLPNGISGNDTIHGGSGIDAMYGFDGDDSIHGGSGDDRGVVTIAFSQPFEFAAGLFGGAGNDLLDGGDGDDDLYGQAGADTMIGGRGIDRFFFDTALGGGNVDKVLDFEAGVDQIIVSATAFAGVGKIGPLKKAAFFKGKKAADKQDRVIYDPDKGKLLFDGNGKKDGGAVLFARLDKGLKLDDGDFAIIA